MGNLEFSLDGFAASASGFADVADASAQTASLLRGASVSGAVFGATSAASAFAGAVSAARDAQIAGAQNVQQVNDIASQKMIAARKLGEQLLDGSASLAR